MSSVLQTLTGPDRFQPEVKSKTGRMDASQETLANIVAVIAFGLPLSLGFGAIFPDVCFHDSISAFYYSRLLGGVFVGSVCVIAALLVAYGGQGKNEWRLATLASIFAALVALLPTNGPKCQTPGVQLRGFAQPENLDMITYELAPIVGSLHVISAIIFFLFLAYFSAYVFTREVKDVHRKNGELLESKSKRNKYYIWCARVIIVCLVLIGLYFAYDHFIGEFALWDRLNLTFVFEAIALWAFGFSWLVKGRVFGRYFLDPVPKPKSSA